MNPATPITHEAELTTALATSLPNDMHTTVESILHVAWKIPLWLIVLLALGLGSMALWLYLSERGRVSRPVRCFLAIIRFALLMSILWMLAGWSWLRFRSDQPELIVVLDRSASMSTRDSSSSGELDSASDGRSRLERAIELFDSLGRRQRERLQRQYQLQWFTLAETLDQIPVDPSNDVWPLGQVTADGSSSRLGDGLTRLVQRQAGKGTAAVIFVSDGINTSGAALSEAAKAARRAAIPIVVVAVGRQTELPDLRLADLLIDRDVYLGDQVTAEVSVIASDVPSTQTRIVLRDRATDKVLDETRVTIAGEQRQATARLSFVPERAGELELRVEAIPIAGEQELDNNFVDETVHVQDKTVRVLLVSDTSNYEYRFLKSFLGRVTQPDSAAVPSFELLTVLQDADPLFVDQDNSALRLIPSQPEQINLIDAFVLIDFDPQLVSQTSQQAIVDAVALHGAGCIFVSGQGSISRRLEGWPLAKLLPVESSPTSVAVAPQPAGSELFWQPTALGSSALPMQLAPSIAQSLAVWQRLPNFVSLARAELTKEGAQLLAQAVDRQSTSESPLLITQFAGAGRTALQASDETYRWTSFLGSDLYYQRYWGQMLRWLSRGKLSSSTAQVELLVEPKQTTVGQPVRFQVTLSGAQALDASDAMVELAVEGSGGRDRTLKLMRVEPSSQVYQLLTSDLPPDSYRARLVRPIVEVPPSEEFTISAPPGEQATLRVNAEALRELSEQSRGRFYLEADAQRLFDELPLGKPTRLGALPSQPIWNSWWVAVLFVTLLTTEWIVRRKCQML